MIQRGFVREDILLKDGGRKQKFQSEEEERFIKKLVDAEVAPKPESFQILKVEDKEENFSFMETMEKESHNTIKNSMEQLKQ